MSNIVLYLKFLYKIYFYLFLQNSTTFLVFM
nr:MAG TPA: hypothetical protein [Caudoviricetes sp.]